MFKVLKEFQTIGSEPFALTHKVGADFDPKAYGTTADSVASLVAGKFLEPVAPPVVKDQKKEQGK